MYQKYGSIILQQINGWELNMFNILQYIKKHVRPIYKSHSSPKGKKKEKVFGFWFLRIPWGGSKEKPTKEKTIDPVTEEQRKFREKVSKRK